MLVLAMFTTCIADRLLDRHGERELLDRSLERVRAGQSSALVVRGEAGIGKTALLDYAVDSARGFRVVRVVGVESEMELPFAALQQLCAPLLDRLERLPGPQREALRVAFGLSAGDPPDRFLVALAVLGLLSEAAEAQPLLIVIDDAQWLDRASVQALAFVARRLLAEPVALVFATCQADEGLRGLPELVVEGLGGDDARELFRSALDARLDEGVEQRLVAEARGNPLALLEVPRASTATGRAGGFAVPVAVPPSRRIEESFRRRLATLPADTRQLLVVAAAEPIGDPLRVWRAVELLGIRAEAADAAEAEGLVTFGACVTFRHPIVRSVVYRAAPLRARREAHRALAHVTDPQVDPDRRAWHRAQAAPGPNEEVASELERSAERARARGGVCAEAAFMERAVALTRQPERRAERALGAARAKLAAGAFDAALGLLATAEAGPLTELQGAHVDRLRAQTAFAASRGTDAPPLLLRAAKRFEPLDAALARETYLEALTAALFAGRLTSRAVLLEAAKAARAAPPAPEPPRASDLLLDGLALLVTDGHGAGVSVLRRTCSAFCTQEMTTEEGLRCLLAAGVAGMLWDAEAWDRLTARLIQLARDADALTLLIFALTTRSTVHLFAGEFLTAASVVEEVGAITGALGSRMSLHGALALAAYRGREAEVVRLIEVTGKNLRATREGMGLTCSAWATAVLYNGLARYEDALPAAQEASDHPNNLRYADWALPELVEAASRTGHSERGAEALRRLSELTQASGTDWALGIEERSRALLSEGEAADRLYREAIERLARTRVRVDLARAHLLYGEWLRREDRRVESRQQLHLAHDAFDSIGANAFAERARRELLATGESVRAHAPEARDELTAQEALIARMARDGQTNVEIGSQLFLSPRTVEYHLRKVFRKLGVTSRTQLARQVPARSAPTARAA
jgi:DNA-binding CsgD family transcriptional regulator